ncbi:MAG: heme-binding protein [Proteobacteria bacterium]|nr:heme-binding protein [Pseudomonadota bacterium]
MHIRSAVLAMGTLAAAGALPARGELLARKDLTLDIALAIATTASATCKAQGYRVTVSVVGRDGELLVVLRGDNSSPHTVENSRRKAYTSRTFRVPSAEFAKRLTDPERVTATQAQATLPGVIALAGALPIKVGEDTIGGVGVSGAPGGHRDEACAKAGIDKVADQLK